jgi:hypothetical protein
MMNRLEKVLDSHPCLFSLMARSVGALQGALGRAITSDDPVEIRAGAIGLVLTAFLLTQLPAS